jgi:hypothetical protein
MKNAHNIKTLEMIRHIRDENYERLRGKSHRERIAFYQKKARKLVDWVESQNSTKSRS